MQRDRLPYLLIPLAACIAILPLILHGCSCGHDFDFHLLSWMEAARQFTHGNLHPQWAYTPAYNAGEPRFVFYPPLSWTLGAILTLILPITAAPIVYTWIALTASGLALHRLAREFTPPTPALLAAILYTVNPYMLFTAYERTAYAELLAAAFIPLLLHAILRQRVTIPRIAIPVALLWLTNAPAAVMSCYVLALLTLIRLISTRNQTNRSTPEARKGVKGPAKEDEEETKEEEDVISTEAIHSLIVNRAVEKPASLPPPQTCLQLTITAITGTTLGLALAAFYILPAAYERRYVQIAMAIIPNMRIQDNFLFHHTGDAPHDQVLHTASIIAVILLTLTIAAIAISLTRSSKKNRLTNPANKALPHFSDPSNSDPSKEISSRPERSVVERPPHFAGTTATPAAPHALYLCRVPHPSRSCEGWDRNTSTSISLLFSLTILTVAIALLLTPLTAIIWNHAPELSFLQFPWRFMAILAAAMSLAVALAPTRLTLKPTTQAAIAIALATALTYPAYAIFRQSCDEEDTPTAREALFRSNHGTDPTDEYTPITADNDSLAQSDPPYWLSPDPNAKAPSQTQPAPTATHLTLNAPIAEELILNLRDYPSWRITDNGALITSRDQRDDGLIAFPIPAGPSVIAITYSHTADQTLGDTLSLLALVTLFVTLRHRPPHPAP